MGCAASYMCDNCHSQLDKQAYILPCTHKFCKACHVTSAENGVTVCPKCDPGKIDRNIEPIQVVPLDQSLFENNKIHRDMRKCEDDVSKDIRRVKIEIERTQAISKEGEEDLQTLYEKRVKQVENHFKKLEAHLKEEANHRTWQLECLMSSFEKIRGSMENIRKEFENLLANDKKETEDEFKTLADRHNRTLDFLDFAIPKYVVHVEPSTDFPITDAISISAPDVPLVSNILVCNRYNRVFWLLCVYLGIKHFFKIKMAHMNSNFIWLTM